MGGGAVGDGGFAEVALDFGDAAGLEVAEMVTRQGDDVLSLGKAGRSRRFSNNDADDQVLGGAGSKSGAPAAFGQGTVRSDASATPRDLA